MNKNGMTTDSGTATHGVEDRIDAIKDTVKGIVDTGAQKVDAIKSKVGDVKEQAFTRGNDLVERVSEMVKSHPLKAVGIAFGAGYLGMRLFRR